MCNLRTPRTTTTHTTPHDPRHHDLAVRPPPQQRVHDTPRRTRIRRTARRGLGGSRDAHHPQTRRPPHPPPPDPIRGSRPRATRLLLLAHAPTRSRTTLRRGRTTRSGHPRTPTKLPRRARHGPLSADDAPLVHPSPMADDPTEQPPAPIKAIHDPGPSRIAMGTVPQPPPHRPRLEIPITPPRPQTRSLRVGQCGRPYRNPARPASAVTSRNRAARSVVNVPGASCHRQLPRR